MEKKNWGKKKRFHNVQVERKENRFTIKILLGNMKKIHLSFCKSFFFTVRKVFSKSHYGGKQVMFLCFGKGVGRKKVFI